MLWWSCTHDDLTDEPKTSMLQSKKGDAQPEDRAMVEMGSMLDDVAIVRVTWDGGEFRLLTLDEGVTFTAELERFQ